jgi:uncharacterized protein (DUF2336 family)
MILRQILPWAQTASATRRAEVAGALARAWLELDLDIDERRDIERAMMTLLDDPSPLVRRTLADWFASEPQAPSALISALAFDQSEISAPVLARSPLLTDAELIDCAATGDAFAQSAIAVRPSLSASVGAALAETGVREAAIALAVNTGAILPAFSLARLVERFGEDAEMRDALLARDDLPPALRNVLINAAAQILGDFVVERGWLSTMRATRILREARDRANVFLVAEAAEKDGREGLRALVTYLRESEQLTAGLVLRALLSGNRDLFETALAELSGLREDKVAAHVRHFRGAGFAALYERAGLPRDLLPAFRSALQAQEEFGPQTDVIGLPHRDSEPARDGRAEPRLSLAMIESVLSDCEAINGGELDRLLALLRRFELEAALEQARAAASAAASDATPPGMIFFPREAPVRTSRGAVIDIAAFEIALRAA